MLALWFVATAVGTSIGGQIGKFTANDPVNTFVVCAAITIVAGLVMLVFSKKVSPPHAQRGCTDPRLGVNDAWQALRFDRLLLGRLLLRSGLLRRRLLRRGFLGAFLPRLFLAGAFFAGAFFAGAFWQRLSWQAPSSPAPS